MDRRAVDALLCAKRLNWLGVAGQFHIPELDVNLVCSCMACLYRWNALCVAVDMVFWQSHLDKGERIPAGGYGKVEEWNQKILADNAAVVVKALTSRPWYAAILEKHLKSSVQGILRRVESLE